MQGTRWFFSACLVISGVLLMITLAGTLSSEDIPEQVADGYGVWQANNCIACHTLYGQGGNYAPDLTHIHSQRGEVYLADFLVDPNAYHPDARVMPRFGLTRTNTEALFAFLSWIDTHEAGDNFPPRPIFVSGNGNLALPSSVQDNQFADDNSPEALGFEVFRQRCASCHTLTDAQGIGPSMVGLAIRAGERVEGQSAEQYIRNSIINPGEYVVDGFENVMAQNLGASLSSDDINNVIAFLLTFDEE